MSYDTLQLWAEIYDSTYTTKQGVGPIRLMGANGTQAFDGPGTGAITTAPLHPDFTIRALDLLTSKVVVEVWLQVPGSDKRLLTAFIADDISYVDRPSGIEINVTGPDVMNLLSNYSTLIAREYDNTTYYAVLLSLLGLAGWTLFSDGVSSTVGFSTRFDGINVFKAIQFVAESGGYHFRLDPNVKKRLVIGALGDDTGVRVAFAKGDKPTIRFNEDVILAEDIEIVDDSRDVVNWILPVGGGDGDSALTLEDSTRTSPYTKQTITGPDGRTLYYLTDSESVATFGQIQRRVNFKQISPLGTSNTSRRNAANLLYDAAATYLTRHKDAPQILRVTLRNVKQRILIGDKIRVHYVETVNFHGMPYTLKNINADFWVIKSAESVGESGVSTVLTVSDVDRKETTDADIVIGQLEGLEAHNVAFKPTFNIWSMGPYQDFFNNEILTFYLNIPDDVLEVTNVTMIVNTLEDRGITFVASGEVTLQLSFFGQNTDEYPQIDIDVNSTQVADDIGSTGAALVDYEVDITDEILGAGDDGRGAHIIEADIVSGNGGVSIQFLIRGTITTGKVT